MLKKKVQKCIVVVQIRCPSNMDTHESVRVFWVDEAVVVGVVGVLPRGIDSDRLAWERCDADPLIKIDVLPFCFKCN